MTTSYDTLLADFNNKFDRSMMGEEIIDQAMIPFENQMGFLLATLSFVDGVVKLEESVMCFVAKKKIFYRETFGYPNVFEILKQKTKQNYVTR